MKLTAEEKELIKNAISPEELPDKLKQIWVDRELSLSCKDKE